MVNDSSKKHSPLRGLREQSGESIHRMAFWLGVSSGHLWNAENGLSRLTPEQESALYSFYMLRIAERVKQLTATLQVEGEAHGTDDGEGKS